MNPFATSRDELDIREGFEAFIDASRRLEQSYAELQARAEGVDVQLADTNRELEKTLLEREMVFASLPVGLLSLNPAGEIRWCNPEGQRLQRQAVSSGRDLCICASGDWAIEGSSVRVRRVGMPDGGTLVVVEDRSQVVHLEREVDRLDRMAGLSELALGIAHEIKNPLNGVMGFAGLMRRSDDAARQREYAVKIESGLGQVDSIVKALLAFARPTDQRAQPAPVRQVIGEAAAAAGVPLNRVSITYGEGCGSAVYIDAPVLGRVLGNLFRNSAEAAGDGVGIDVYCELIERRMVLTVRDDGPGVPIAHAEKIFQPFFSTKDRGHGLGLALAGRVLSFFEGHLELVNAGEPGATFKITMPALAAATATEMACG